MAFGSTTDLVNSALFQNDVAGGKREGYLTAPGPASYTTGGDDLDFATALSLPAASFLDVMEGISTDGLHRCIWDKASGKAKVYDLAGTEVVATTDLSLKTYQFHWISIV